MADLLYISEKYAGAVRLMATTDAPLRQQVRDAYVSSAGYADTVGGGLPNVQPSTGLPRRMESLRERVVMDGTYDTSFKVMSEAEVKAIAEEILDIDSGIASELRDH